MTSDVEHLSVYLLAGWMSSFEKWAFSSSAHLNQIVYFLAIEMYEFFT